MTNNLGGQDKEVAPKILCAPYRGLADAKQITGPRSEGGRSSGGRRAPTTSPSPLDVGQELSGEQARDDAMFREHLEDLAAALTQIRLEWTSHVLLGTLRHTTTANLHKAPPRRWGR